MAGPGPHGTHVHHEEASGLHVAPGQREAPQQVSAPAAVAGKLPAQEGQPGREGRGAQAECAPGARGGSREPQGRRLAAYLLAPGGSGWLPDGGAR